MYEAIDFRRLPHAARRKVFYMREFSWPAVTGKMCNRWLHYLTALDRQMREQSEYPSIGIILCKEKNRTVVEYALQSAQKPIGVASYHVVKRLPKELKGQLPSPAEIAKLLEDGE
ncbi:MAG: DUF1016 family protein [Fimbriimonadaceae bacterium]|nr:DUF1016 family protein [Fimbriimonadaceae bacterium]MBX3649393.1 DUF1016 family protein [Rhodocyclaceae bacterium]